MLETFLQVGGFTVETMLLCLTTLILFRLRKIENDAAEMDKRHRNIKTTVDVIAGKLEAMERVTFPAMVREIGKEI